MDTMMKEAIRQLEEINMGGLPIVAGAPAPVQTVRTETDRKIAALELGLPEDAPWGRIDRVAEADTVASPKNYR